MTTLKLAAPSNRLWATLPTRSWQAFVASCEHVKDHKPGEIAIPNDAGLSTASCRCDQQGSDISEQLLGTKRASTRARQAGKPQP